MAQQTENEKILILNPETFSITFYWKNKYVKVKLKNGDDIIKLADIFSNMLIENGIESIIETSEFE